MSERCNIDAEGFRPNVAIVIANRHGQVLWARRVGGKDEWQFPQGGIRSDENEMEAMYRELKEEVGIGPDDVEVLSHTTGWLRYRIPESVLNQNPNRKFLGQKQKWFLLLLKSNEERIDLAASDKPEFDTWHWVSYWYPLSQVVKFKRDVYRVALSQLVSALPKEEC